MCYIMLKNLGAMHKEDDTSGAEEKAHDKLAIIVFKFKTLREIPEPH